MGVRGLDTPAGIECHRDFDRQLRSAERRDRSGVNAMSPDELLAGLAVSDDDVYVPLGDNSRNVRSVWLANLKEVMGGQMLMRTTANTVDSNGDPISNLPPLRVVVNLIRPYAHELEALEAIVEDVGSELTGKESAGRISSVRDRFMLDS